MEDYLISPRKQPKLKVKLNLPLLVSSTILLGSSFWAGVLFNEHVVSVFVPVLLLVLALLPQKTPT